MGKDFKYNGLLKFLRKARIVVEFLLYSACKISLVYKELNEEIEHFS